MDDHIRVLIVDDHPIICEALQGVVDCTVDLQLSGAAHSAEEALQLAAEQAPDVAVIDISLGSTGGLELIEHLQEKHPQVSTLVFSMYDEEVYAERAIRAGASGYLMKSEPMEEVAEAIRSVYRNEIHLSSRLFSRILRRMSAEGIAEPQFAIDELTERERTVVQLLGEGCSVEEIKDRLGLARKTVDTHRRHAKEKLGLESVTELRQYALQRAMTGSQAKKQVAS